MPIVYQVTISPAKKKQIFNISWYNRQTREENSFTHSAAEITTEEIERLWQLPKYQLEIGGKLYRFLDGDARHLERALQEAAHQAEPLILHLCTCKETADWPFELLARDNLFLLPQRMHLIRCISDWGSEKKTPPKNRPLKLLFMACSALDVQPELDFEKEEETIFQVTENLAVNMEVEDSGSLEGLRQQLEQEEYDVVHLSGHADIDKHGQPFFVMEDETGRRQDVLPGELWEEALIENPPRLLFLSGCRTGETPQTGAAVSFARELVEKYDIPAVLGWGRSVADKQATHAEKMIYKELSRGRSIHEAIQRARVELVNNFPGISYPAWPLLRLFSSGLPLSAIVKKGQQIQLKPRRMKHTYLKQSQVKILEEGFVGRRRQLQHSLKALKHDRDKIGVLLHGTGGLGKSCLAGKICEQFSQYTLIIVHGRFNAITMEQALKDAFIAAKDETGEKILAAEAEMTDKLAKLCASAFKEKNYFILLDDFEQNLEGADQGQPGPLLPEAVLLLQSLLHYLHLSGKMTQLIITSRYGFTLSEQNRDLVKERLRLVCLTSFQPAEQRKKAQELKHILNYPEPAIASQLLTSGRGNPRLMEWLDILVGQISEAEVPQLLEAVKDKQEEFIRRHVIRALLRRGGEELERLLRWLSIYRRPVLIEGVRQISGKAGLEGWQELLHLGLGLSLVEHDQARKSYGVTPLLREELLTGLDHLEPCHQAAFSYYKKICESNDRLDPILVEEWIFHALGCGAEDTASRQGGRLVGYLRKRLAFRESRRVGEWVLEEKKQELATEHDAVLLNEVAGMLKALGEPRKAIDYYEQALAILKEVYGEKHPQVATALNNLGLAWNDLGGHRKAIQFFEQALAILKEVYGEKNQNVASALNNLGLAWNDLGETQKAFEYYEQALAIWKEVYGGRHHQVAAALNNLGGAWQALGESRKAIEYYEQALAIDEAVFGKEHPNVAIRLNNLGGAYFAQGQTKKAKPYFERAYAIWKKFFGDEHPHTKAVKQWLKKVE
jgi:tetratricopeptide (TPR) repeat protein